MSTATAQVEVLTAEVRVLMVGKRQVTLSVFRQLDTVASWHIVPFGRVRDSQFRKGAVQVVGVHVETDTLVRAWALPTKYMYVHRELYVVDFPIPDGMQVTCHSYGGIDVTDPTGLHTVTIRRGFEQDSPIEDELLPYALTAWGKECVTYDEWKQLPLIVLAGLR